MPAPSGLDMMGAPDLSVGSHRAGPVAFMPLTSASAILMGSRMFATLSTTVSSMAASVLARAGSSVCTSSSLPREGTASRSKLAPSPSRNARETTSLSCERVRRAAGSIVRSFVLALGCATSTTWKGSSGWAISVPFFLRRSPTACRARGGEERERAQR
eukprot:scaffold173733_cov35-Tisochrysis_lutea.AAC.1